MRLTRPEQAAVQKAEQFRNTAKEAIVVGDLDRAAAYLQAAADHYEQAARLIAVRRTATKKAGVES